MGKFSKLHPVYTKHKLSLVQLEALETIATNKPGAVVLTTALEKLQLCELVYKYKFKWYVTEAGRHALDDAREEGWGDE